MNGYILVGRQLFDHWIWNGEPFSKGQAWIDLLLLANFKDTVANIDTEPIEVKRGQLFRSIGFLANRWGWSENKVRRYLGILKREGMCTYHGTPYGTLITIENYETWQNGRRANEGTDGRANGRSDGRHKNKGKRNKVKEESEYARAPTFEEVRDYVQQMGYEMDPAAFYDYYQETEWTKKNGQPIRDWRASVRTWNRREREFRKGGQYGNGSELPEYRPQYHEPAKLEPLPEPTPMPDYMKKLFGGGN